MMSAGSACPHPRPGLRPRALALRALAPLAVVLALSACKTDLYSALEEREANEMVAILDRFQIPATKTAQKDGVYSVAVEKSEFAQAVEILGREGYPKRKFGSLAEMFDSSGLIPTPFEQRVRYLYGISEELSHTISLFDGVVETRVHVVLPSADGELGAESRRGKASVYIKHDPLFDFTALLPKIKSLVADSIDGVDYDGVEVLALPAPVTGALPAVPAAYMRFLGVDIRPDDRGRAVFLLTAAGALILVLAGAVGWLWWRQPQSWLRARLAGG